MVQERLATAVVIKTDGWQGYSFLDAAPGLRHKWLVPGFGEGSTEGLALGPHLDR